MSFQEYASSLDEKAKFGRIKSQHLVGIAVIVALAIGFAIYTFTQTQSAGGDSFSVQSSEVQEQSSDSQVSSIFVHVSGCVKSPGLIELQSGVRLAVAIERAGGFGEDANIDAINLAKKLEDGEQIVVPAKSNNSAEGAEQGAASSTTESQSTSSSGKININTADSSELQKISGIGSSKAGKIIAYRKSNGSFKTVDELTNVSGIGEKTLAAIRDQICV